MEHGLNLLAIIAIGGALLVWSVITPQLERWNIAFERAAGAIVGVAISVTTIPAAAYVGDAIALGRSTSMWGALVVLCTNVVAIVAASTTTLWFQRHRRRRLAT